MGDHTPKSEVKLLRLPHAEGLSLPDYQSEHASGVDLIAAVPDGETCLLAPGQRQMVPTGVCLEMPTGLEAQIRPRSGLAARFGLTVLNSPGTIDADYRGELQVILINHGEEPFEIMRGMRIAQLVFQPVVQVRFIDVVTLARTKRGAGGFGSSGGLD